MVGALNSASSNGRIAMKPAPPIVYLVDGKFLRMPIAKRAYHYKTPRWLPVTFSPTAPGTLKEGRA